MITRENQSEDYDTGDVKLIFKNTLDDEESGQPKKYTINAKSVMAPDVFYYVHIDVDLDQIKDCTCQTIYCNCRNSEESDYETNSGSESESSAALQKPDIDVKLDQVQDCLTQEADCEDQVEERDSDNSAGTESCQDVPPKKARLSR